MYILDLLTGSQGNESPDGDASHPQTGEKRRHEIEEDDAETPKRPRLSRESHSHTLTVKHVFGGCTLFAILVCWLQ